MTDDEARIPIAQEELAVSSRTVETARVRVSKVVHEQETPVQGSVRDETVEVQRIAMRREVAGPLDAHMDGEWLVIPVVEEVAVVQKRWILKEELRLRRRSIERRFEEKVVLKSEEAVVERREP
jgi:uncharacterized protein (TIGR02271 family)